jgi:hypothetical protein
MQMLDLHVRDESVNGNVRFSLESSRWSSWIRGTMEFWI